VLLYSALFGFLIFYPLQQQLAAAVEPEQQGAIARLVLDLHARVWPCVGAIALLIALQSLFVTHRVVGPAFHLQRVLQQLAAGDLAARAHLRRWDRLKELEAAVNRLGEALAAREARRADAAARGATALTELRASLTEPVSPAARRALAALDKALSDAAER
jgi:HAMP domain-containing protein